MKPRLLLPCFVLMLLSSCFLLSDPIRSAADQEQRVITIPTVDHEVFALLEPIAVDAMRIATEREYERPEAISYLREVIAPVVEGLGRDRVVAALFIYSVLAERPVEYAPEFHSLSSTILRVLEPSAEEKVRILGPFWPPEDGILDSQRLENAYLHVFTLVPGEAVRITPDIFIAELKAAWSRGDHRLDGLVDYLYDSDPVLSCNAFMRATMRNYPDLDSLSIDDDSIPRVTIPDVNDTYYLARPEALPEGTIPKAIEFLRQEAKSDIFWSRLMVAVIVHKIPYLRDPEIEATLREDPHWLIQRRMAYLDDEEEPDSETADER